MHDKVYKRIRLVYQNELNAPLVAKAVLKFNDYLSQSNGQMRRTKLMAIILRGLNDHDEQACDVAAMGEIIHMASLLHDDVIDASSMRRSQTTFHIHNGNKNAILIGDLLLALALEKLGNVPGSQVILPMFIEAVKGLAVGEMLQHEWKGRMDIPLEVYLRIIANKTGGLFAAFSASAAYLALGSEQKCQEFKQLGQDFGSYYQKRDDLLDCSSYILNKDARKDFMNKYCTYPLIMLQSKLSQREAQILTDSWGHEDGYRDVERLLKQYGIYEELSEILTHKLEKMREFLYSQLNASTHPELDSYFEDLFISSVVNK